MQDAVREKADSLHELIDTELTELRWRWGIWKGVWMDNGACDTIAAGGSTHTLFFHIVRDSLLDDIFLHLNRLLDPPKQGTHENLVIERLVGMLGIQTLSPVLERLRAFREQIETVRHKRLAHADLSVALKGGLRVHYGVTDTRVDEAMRDIDEVMKAIRQDLHPGLSIDYTEQEAQGMRAAGAIIDRLRKNRGTT